MIKALTITVVFIVLVIIASIKMNRDIKKMKALEELLDEYYKKREQRLMKHKKD